MALPIIQQIGKFFHAICTDYCQEKAASKMPQKDVDPEEWDLDMLALFLYGGEPDDTDLKDEAKDGNKGAKTIYKNFKTFQKCIDWAKANLKTKIELNEKSVPSNYTHAYIWSFEADGMKFTFETEVAYNEVCD